MNSRDASSREQLLAVVLSAAMVASVVAVGGAAFAGSATAQTTQTTITVDDSGGADYTTIQAAVDNATAGDTIQVEPGTYTERVNIDKGLTLTSTAGPAKTTITKDVDSGITGVIISQAELSGLTIEGFTIKGTSDTNGIAFQNQGSYENVTLRNNVLIGKGTGYNAANLWNLDGTITIANNEFTGGSDGLNVQGDESTTQTTDLVVTGNTFHDLGDNGAEFNAINDLTFDNNTITKHGQKETAAGLEVAEDARIGPVTGTVTITDNTITDGPVGVGIYPNKDGSGRPLSISGNTFRRNDVHLNDRTGTIDTGTVVSDNTFDRHVVVINRSGSSLLPIIWGEIQGAVDGATSGDTVDVSPGTYKENVTVGTANVTLRGPNAGTPGDASRGPEATIVGQVILAANGTVLDGFDVSPPPASTNQGSEAVRVSNTPDDVVVRNNVVREFNESGLPQWEGLEGINVFGGSSSDAIENVTVTANRVVTLDGRDTKGGAAGISIQGNVVGATVTDNDLDDIGNASTAWAFGITVRGTGNHGKVPTNVTVDGNDIDSVVSNPATKTVGVGIGLESGTAADVNFTDNDISNTGYLFEDKTTTVDLEAFVAANTIDRGARLENAFGGTRNVIFNSTQDAVNAAAAGDTINVEPGTYEEQVNIDKGLTLRATAGPANTVITNDGGQAVIGSTSELSGLTIEGFTLEGTGGTYGIYLTNQGSYENVTLRNNVIRGSGKGISAALLWDLDGTITVANNEFTANYDGLNVQGNESSTRQTDLVVTGNTFSGLGDNGAEFNDIRNLTFENNALTNYAGTAGDTAAGVEIAEDGNVTGEVIVRGNRIRNGNVAIGVFPTAGDRTVSITENSIKASSVTGVRIHSGVDATTVSAHENGINGAVNNGTGQFNATRNWWGAATGPSGEGPGTGASVSENVTFRPFYTNAARTVLSDAVNSSSVGANGTAVINLSGQSENIDKVAVSVGSGTSASVSVAESTGPTGNATNPATDEPSGVQVENVATYTDIAANETVSGPTTVAITVDGSTIADIDATTILHYVGGQWKVLDTSAQRLGDGDVRLTATVSSLSPFAVAEVTAESDSTAPAGGGGGGGGVPSTPTATPAPTSTPASTPTSTPAATPTSTPAATPTSTPASTPTSTPAATPTSTPEPQAQSTPTSTPEPVDTPREITEATSAPAGEPAGFDPTSVLVVAAVVVALAALAAVRRYRG